MSWSQLFQCAPCPNPEDEEIWGLNHNSCLFLLCREAYSLMHFLTLQEEETLSSSKLLSSQEPARQELQSPEDSLSEPSQEDQDTENQGIYTSGLQCPKPLSSLPGLQAVLSFLLKPPLSSSSEVFYRRLQEKSSSLTEPWLLCWPPSQHLRGNSGEGWSLCADQSSRQD